MFTPLIVILVGLLVAIPLVEFARRAGISYPVVLLAVGLVLGFVPGLPQVRLDPNLVLLIFLPPLLYWEAVTAPTDVMLANPSQIGMLVIGLVLACTVTVALAAHAVVPGLPWSVAFVLGAIVAPTDELAAVPVLERFKIPRHVVAIIEGESLVNDALSLVLYAAAVAAVVTGRFNLGQTVLQIALATGGALLLGFIGAKLAIEAWRRISDPQLQGVISVSLPFVVYTPAQWIGVSGVIAVITTGVYASRFTPTVITARTRLQGVGFWESFVFLANAVLFLLLGLQMHGIAGNVVARYSLSTVLFDALVVNATVIFVRFAWTLATEYVPFVGGSSEHEGPDWKHAVIVAASGLRGSVSLAAALAIPLTLGATKTPFPFRDLVIFLTFSVILVTLIGGGGLLPLLIRALKLPPGDDEEVADLRRALAGTASAALERIAALEREQRIDAEQAQSLRERFERKQKLAAGERDDEDLRSAERLYDAERDVIAAERRALVAMRRRGEIDNAVLRRVQARLDVAEAHITRLE